MSRAGWPRQRSPPVRPFGQVWAAGAYFFVEDPGLPALTRGQPEMDPKPAVAEDYFDRLDRHLRARGAIPAARKMTVTVINSQNEPITITGVWAQVLHRKKVDFAAEAGDQTGGPRDTMLHFDLARDRPPGVLQCGSEGCEISKEAQDAQQEASYFAVDPLNIPPNETRNFNAILDGDDLVVTFRFLLTIVSLNSGGTRTPQEVAVTDAGGHDFHGVSGESSGGTFYVINSLEGGITKNG